MLDQTEMVFPEALRSNATYHPRGIAVACGADRRTWREFYDASCRVANALLDRGLATGDRVAFVMHDSIEMYTLLWGTIMAGGVIVPLSVMLRPESLGHMLRSARPRYLVVDAHSAALAAAALAASEIDVDGRFALGDEPDGWSSAADLLHGGRSTDPPVSIRRSDLMCIMYSSGTTGAPKGSAHTHAAREIYTYGGGLLLNFHRRCVALCATPLYANGTWMTVQPCAYVGGTVSLLDAYSAPALFEAVQRDRVTHVFLVPTQLIGILADPTRQRYDLSSLEVVVMAGAPLAHNTLVEAMAAFPHVRFCEMYGLSEGWLTMAFPEDRTPGRELTAGRPMFASEIVVVDPGGAPVGPGELGELVGRGPGLMREYFGDAAATKASTWCDERGRAFLRSGDLGYIDDDGYVFVSGRVKDMIISGGINIFAADIEAVVLEHPAVREIAVIGIPHAKWGETPVAFAILESAATTDGDEIVRWANERLARYQRLAAVTVCADLPRAQYGKVAKKVLREPYWDGHERSI